MNPTYVTFGLYLIMMIGVGLYFVKRASSNLDEYLLGGRGLGSWVTALSAQASDMSGWMLMGLPGAIYLSGLDQSWVAIGLILGTFGNWMLVAPRLRSFTEELTSLTLPTFLDRRFKDPTRLLRLVSAVLTLFFFTIYAASGLTGAGLLFENMFKIDFKLAVIIGMTVMIVYTLLGGFLAVCWTDLVQGVLMFIAIVAVPAIAWWQLEPGALTAACTERGISLGMFPNVALSKGGENFLTNYGLESLRGAMPIFLGLLAIISTMAWGLGYCGQPHILSRFMAIKSIKLLPRTTVIAMVWVVIALTGSVCVGLVAIPLYDNLQGTDAEQIFISMVTNMCHAGFAGVLLAAILAAIMSTIDSQLLTSSSILVEDFYLYLLRPKASVREQMLMGRLCVLLISVLACLMALEPNQTIFGLVKFAWGGLGAVFGPAVLAALYWKNASYQGIISGMVVGATVLLLWYVIGAGAFLYELAPGFMANFLTIWLVSRWKPASEMTQSHYEKLVAAHEEAKR